MCSDIIDISFVLVINAYLCSAISLTSILRCINCFKLSLSKSASTTFSILLRLTKGVFPSSGMCLLYSGSNIKSPILIALGSLSTYPLVWHKNNLDHILLAGLRDFWVWNWEKNHVYEMKFGTISKILLSVIKYGMILRWYWYMYNERKSAWASSYTRHSPITRQCYI